MGGRVPVALRACGAFLILKGIESCCSTSAELEAQKLINSTDGGMGVPAQQGMYLIFEYANG
jgi:hypothetical protein